MFIPKHDTMMSWCQKKLGKSRCKRIKLCYRKDKWLGEWDWEGTIRLNINQLHSTTSLYRTLAHEWTHAQQRYKDYVKLDKIYKYEHHPLEVHARRVENSLWKNK
jgi:hypothetical protein